MSLVRVSSVVFLVAAGLFAIGVALETFGSNEEPQVERWFKDPSNPPTRNPILARHSLKVPSDLGDAEICHIVENLFLPSDDEWNQPRLEMVGKRAVPFLVDALDDARIGTARFPDAMVLDGQSALERIVELLSPFGPPQAAQPLAKLIDSKDAHIRRYAGYGIGCIGALDCVAPMKKVLADDDDYVRHQAMMGIEKGLETQHSTQAFQEAIFLDLCALLDREESAFCDLPPKLLLQFDSDRAVPILFSEQYFNARNRELADIVKTVNDAQIDVPLRQLKMAIRELKGSKMDVKTGNAYAELLIAYGRNPDADAEQLFRDELGNEHGWIAYAAADSLMELAGVRDPVDYVLELSWSEASDQMTRPQRVYYLAWNYDSEVQNGGHLQYFVNSTGADYPAALSALEEIGATQSAAILAGAIADVGLDSETQQPDMEVEITKEVEDKLAKRNDPFYDSDESIDWLLKLYVLEHPEHFRRKGN